MNHIRIVDEFHASINFGYIPVNNNNPQRNIIRIIEIKFCPTFMDGIRFVISDQFHLFLNSLPYAFVIIIRCENENKLEIFENAFEDLNRRFFNVNRPILIFFESPISWRILYKNYGVSQVFQEVMEAMINEANEVNDFNSLIANLQAGGYGFFNGHLMLTTINTSINPQVIDENTIEDLIEIFADRNDFMCLRFLHLFNPNLRPNERIISRILRDGFLNNNVDGFTAIYEHDFIVTIPAGHNLLMVAIIHENAEAAEILIRSGVNLNATVNFENAADLACTTGQFNILSTLLKYNSQYPHNFNLKNAHLAEIGDIQSIAIVIHDTIRDVDEDNDFEAAKDILINATSVFPNMKFWYDLANQSAVTKAILRRKFNVYRLLLQIGLYMGPYEDIAAIKENLNTLEQQKIAEINAEIAQNLTRDYLLTLRTNSLVWQQNPDHEDQLERINQVFEILNENEFIQPILKIVAASRDFRIIFDFNRTSVEAVDFTCHGGTEGVFQSVQISNFHVYIGARDLLEQQTFSRTIGTLAHELCHFAMLLTYNNLCKPYDRGDRIARAAFNLITKRCMFTSLNGNENEREEIVALVNEYDKEKQHAEMITRAPHMMMLYQDNPRFEQLQLTYNDLFTDYTTRVIPNVMSRIQQVQDNFYERIRLEHTYWVKKAKKEKMIRYSLISGIMMAICVVIGLTLTLSNVIGCRTNLSNNCTWDKLDQWEKNEILDTKVNFQSHQRTIRSLTENNPKALSRLTNEELRNPQNIVLNKKNWEINFEYFERKFTRFDESYMHFSNAECPYQYNPAVQYSLNSILNKSQFYVLTGEPFSGKTTELINICASTTQNNSDIWVSYLNVLNLNFASFVDHSNLSITNLTSLLLSPKNINQNSFESEIFRKKFEKGEIILFIDNIDWIFEQNEKFGECYVENLVRKSHKNSVFWFGTRSWYSDKIAEIIKKINGNFYFYYKLLPLYCKNRDEYLNKTLKAAELTSSQFNSAFKKINEILKPLEVWRNMKTTKIDNIYLLKVIASHTADNILKNRSSDLNIYDTLDEFIRKAENFNTSSKDSKRNLFGQSIALHLINNNYKREFESVNVTALINYHASSQISHADLPNSTVDISSSPDGDIKNLISSGLIMKDNEDIKFLSPVYFEFYVAQYIVDELWNMHLDPSSTNENNMHKYKNNINLLLNIFKDSHANHPVIRRCIQDYVKKNQADHFRRKKFTKTFKRMFKESFDEISGGTNILLEESMEGLFEDDLDMQNILKRKSLEN